MRVSDYTIPTEELKASASLRQAVLSMQTLGVDCLPVADNDHHFVGLLTADAVALATAGDRRDPGRTRARRIMLTDCCQCYADDEIEAVVRAMTARRVRRSVVLDRDRHPIGILALGDLPMRHHKPSSIETIMDCDQLERNWIDAARKALGGAGPRADGWPARPSQRRAFVVAPTPTPAYAEPAYAEPAVPEQATGLLPMSAFVEAYLDYHG